MRFTHLLLVLIVFLGLSANMYAQRDCGAMEYLEYQNQMDPERSIRLDEIENHTRNVLNSGARAENGIITIPVVVHVVWNTGAENISDAQILSQITVLNEDFRRLNADADGTWPQAADSEIEFCLATVDPQGNATTGITRTNTTVTSFSTNDAVKFSSSGGHDAWPASDYLNIWVCNISGGILGYAQFPGGSAATDGIVNDYLYFGTTGVATTPFDLGRTATHEVGHWLNLRHIWGDGGCSVDDFVSDTPIAGGPNFSGAPCTFPGPNSCDEGAGDQPDMFQNYMDYSDDACMNLYTDGQKTRMRALFEPGGFRESLLNSTGCGVTNPPTCNDGIQNGNETDVDCGGPDCPACPTCSDGIQNGNETDVDCGGPDCPTCPTPATCSDGIQNGDETGVDCGGSCPPCAGPCTYSGISSDSFESGWGATWEDGGADCQLKRSKNSWDENFSIMLRDNTNGSVMTTKSMDLSNYDELKVEFYFKTISMEDGEDFWLQYKSEDTYITVASYIAGTSFSNDNFYTATVTIPGPFSSNTTLRFRCDASANNDRVYIDDVTISGCSTGAGSRQQNNTIAEQNIVDEIVTPISDINLFPNPTRDQLNVTFTAAKATDMHLMVTNYAGKVMQKLEVKADTGKQNTVIDASQMAPGMYILHMITKDKIVAKKFVVTR